MITESKLKKIVDSIVGVDNQEGDYSSDGYAELALSSTKPATDGTNITEPTGNNYARVKIGGFGDYSNINHMSAAAVVTEESGTKKVQSTNTTEIHFNEATGAWGTLPYFAIFRSNVCVYVGKLTTSIAPVANTVPLIRPNALKVYFEVTTLD